MGALSGRRAPLSGGSGFEGLFRHATRLETLNQGSDEGRRLKQPRSGGLAGGRTALAPASAARERTKETSRPRILKPDSTERSRDRALANAEFRFQRAKRSFAS